MSGWAETNNIQTRLTQLLIAKNIGVRGDYTLTSSIHPLKPKQMQVMTLCEGLAMKKVVDVENEYMSRMCENNKILSCIHEQIVKA